jgi:hypothetical protein
VGHELVYRTAPRRRVGPLFFAEHSVAELRQKDDFWLGQPGRLTQPMLLDDGATHYRPVSWDEAFGVIGEELRGLDSPDEAIFYTSGRTSNEAAFAYQLLVRGLGTNNLPDCSNMCHESSAYALTKTIGIGKGSVSLEDLYHRTETCFPRLPSSAGSPGGCSTAAPRLSGPTPRGELPRSVPAVAARGSARNRWNPPSHGCGLGVVSLFLDM